jgi:hypothetical protein
MWSAECGMEPIKCGDKVNSPFQVRSASVQWGERKFPLTLPSPRGEGERLPFAVFRGNSRMSPPGQSFRMFRVFHGFALPRPILASSL